MLKAKFIFLDFVLTCLAFLMIGCCFHISARVFGARTTLTDSLIAGFYLSAFWPYFLIPDYILVASVLHSAEGQKAAVPAKVPLDSPPTVYDLFIVLSFVAICIFVLIKIVPAVKYVHSVGAFRASVVSILGILFFGLVLWLVFYEMSERLLKEVSNESGVALFDVPGGAAVLVQCLCPRN
jgi:hypothetical protein